MAYPDCKAPEPSKYSDSNCDNDLDIEECGFDGGDCCAIPLDGDEFLNGVCNPLEKYNNGRCRLDNDDCVEHNRKYPGGCFLKDVSLLGNGACDGSLYLSEGCNNDDGD